MSAQPKFPPRPEILQNRFEQAADNAARFAKEITDAGGIAWVEAEYGPDHGHDNVFWGYRVHWVTGEAMAEHVGVGVVRAALSDACVTIRRLADQQAMADDWYEEKLVGYEAVARGEEDEAALEVAALNARADAMDDLADNETFDDVEYARLRAEAARLRAQAERV